MSGDWGNVSQGLLRLARRWVWAGAGGVTGALLMFVWRSELHEEHAQLVGAVQSLRETTQGAASPAASLAADALQVPEALTDLERLPAVGDTAGLWLVFQQGLQQQGLQVQALKPQALQAGGPLASQALAMRLQGRWTDLASAWDSLVDAGPVWTLDRLSVSTGGPGGQLQWDGLWRLWLRPDRPGKAAWPAQWSVPRDAPPTRPRAGGGPLLSELAMTMNPAGVPPAQLSADPRQWPLAQIRLWGVWQQGDKPQAVLGAGDHWVVLSVGERLAREDYRVKTIYPDALELQALKRPGDVQVLRLQEGAP